MKKISRRGFVKTAAAIPAAGCLSGGLGVSGFVANERADGEDGYRSPWQRLPDRYWTGPDTWANPWEDWQIQGGKLVCTKAARGNRNVHCLTHQLNDASAEAEIAVTVEYCGAKASETGEGLVEQIGKGEGDRAVGSAGMEIGIRVKDPIDDYRSRLLFGSGMPVGITGAGELVIGRRARAESPALAAALAAGKPVLLVCRIRPEPGKGTFEIELEAVGHGTVRQTGIAAEQVAGNVALVNNLPENVAKVKPAGLFAFSDWTIAGPKITASPGQGFGPILWTLYTLSKRVMKMTAQMPPLGPADRDTAELQTQSAAGWKTVAAAKIDPLAHTATFRVADWDDSKDTPYRVLWTQEFTDGTAEEHTWSGTVRRDPKEKPEIVVAGYCCFIDYLFPNVDLVRQTAQVDPDVMLFTGDQIYEGVGGFGIIREGDIHRMTVNYLRKVALVGWSFREFSKDRPTVWMPDDHDVYHGNLWGAGGRKITLEEWNGKTEYQGSPCTGSKGGYVQPAEFVKAVERTQTAHLPDPFDPTPVEQGIGVYYTAMDYGRVSFAILEDRKFKSGPMAVFEHKSHRPDWITDRAAALAADVPEAVLLGDRQLKFLRDWVADWCEVDCKMAVSQTIFSGAATHHGAPGHFLVADMDSNGWPQSGRKAALDLIRRGHALMLAGDQHVPTIIQHGIREHHDAGFSFCVPAGATGYQRWWRPEEIGEMERVGERHDDRPNTGEYADGFGNLVDVCAVANPPIERNWTTRLDMGQKKSAGFGVVRVDKRQGTFTLEAWPVGVDPTGAGAENAQYPGWPMTVTAADCGGAANPTLPPVVLQGWNREVLPVVQVCDASGELVTMARMTGRRFSPRVFDPDGEYTVRLIVAEAADPRDRVLKTFEKVRVGPGGELVARFEG
ncbi:MAG TPA: alkaline phosphatase D family protein [Thermoguttaceae bacterium]|nr:alkaline phosphatase D family protein [Thermoguttaceae bacterium]